MLETLINICEMKIIPDDLFLILKELHSQGWKPALYSTQNYFLNQANIEFDYPIFSGDRRMYYPKTKNYFVGDIFFREKDLFYIVNHRSENERHREGAYFIRQDKPIYNAIEVGVISEEPENIENQLKEFTDIIEESIKKKVDGRKTRYVEFYWSKLNTNSGKIKNITNNDDEGSSTLFEKPKCDDDEIQSSILLNDNFIRKLLIEISQAGFAREMDIITKKNKKISASKLNDLKTNKLLITDILIECKKTGSQLTKVKERSLITKAGMEKLSCPYCNAQFKDEKITEIYSVSQKGKKLITKSHWQTIFVVDKLTQNGIDKDDIICNVSDSGEEVDLLVEFMGELWIFELKDREFGSGDAYPLNYRQVKYKANKAFIVTTEEISPDAKKVINDLLSESQRDKKSVVFIEGHQTIDDILSKEVSNAILNYSKRRISHLGAQLGIDIEPILNKKYENQELV